MEKRNLCQLATILSGLFAITVSTRIDMVAWQWQDDKPMGATLGQLATQCHFRYPVAPLSGVTARTYSLTRSDGECRLVVNFQICPASYRVVAGRI